jgi:hypothetical protein
MEKGYQQELTYRHSDGSFSAFGSNDDSGSTWFVALPLNIPLLASTLHLSALEVCPRILYFSILLYLAVT